MTVWLNNQGSDLNSGLSSSYPKRTFASAMAALRSAGAITSGDVTLYIAGSQDHYIDTAEFWVSSNNPVNGAVKIRPYGSGRPWLSGGERVSGFSATSQQGVVEALFTGKPRHVWQGARKTMFRARLGQSNPLYSAFEWDTATKSMLISSSLVPSLAALMRGDLEMLISIGWSKSFLRVFSISDAGSGLHRVFFKYPENVVEFAKGDLANPGAGIPFSYGPYHQAAQRFWWENSREFCNVQGSWHANGSTLALGIPNGVASIVQLEDEGVFAGKTQTALVLYSPSILQPVGPFDIEGIGFKHFDWSAPNESGYVGYYDGLRLTYDTSTSSLAFSQVPAVIEAYNTQGFRVHDCVVLDVGGVAIRAFGYKDLKINGNAFVNVASSSIIASSSCSVDAPVQGLDPNILSRGLYIKDNVFVDSGNTYTGSAVADNCALDSYISNNNFLRGTDGAISVGFGARTKGGWPINVNVSFNDIDGVMSYTTDGAAVYFNGNINGSVPTAVPLPHNSKVNFFANKIKNVRKSGFDPSGGKTSAFYVDLGSSAVWARQNWIIDCDVAFQENCALFNRVTDNRIENTSLNQFISYAGYNSYDADTKQFTLYEAPTENPASAISLAKFNGTGQWAGRAFKDIQPFSTPQAVLSPLGVYNTLSLYERNNALSLVPLTGFGASIQTKLRFSEYLL